MTYRKYLILTIALILFLNGCSNNNRSNIPSNLYASAQKKLQKGNYEDAIKDLEILDNLHPLSSYTQQVQLLLIYAYYKSANLLAAQTNIDRFLRFNPTHPNIDYVLYMRSLTIMALDDNKLQRFLGVDRFDRDTQCSLAVFHNLKKFICDYPNSRYVADAEKHLVFLKNRLAQYELSVVKFYDKRGAYIAVANRVEKMLRDFPDTQATYQALWYMEKAYRELQLNDQADKVSKIIATNLIWN